MTRAAPFLLLIAGAFLCYGGTLIRDLGFYHDDWFYISQCRASPPGFSTLMTTLLVNDPTEYSRPLNLPLWAALYGWFGDRSLGWHGALLGVHAGLAWLTYLILRRFEAGPALSFLGALVFLAYPSKDSTLYWCVDIINPMSLLCLLAAYLMHLRYVEMGRAWALAGSVLGILLAHANYDQCALLFPAFLITPALFTEGIPRRVRIGFAAAAAASIAFVAYKIWFVPRVIGARFNKEVALSLFGAGKVYLAALNANFGPRLALFTLKSAAAAAWARPITALGAVLLPWAALRLGGGEDKKDCTSIQDALVVLGAAVFILGYLPIALSTYIPTPLNHQNRLNLISALGAVLALTGCVAGAPAWRPGSARLLAGFASFFLLAHGGFARNWAESSRRHRDLQGLIIANISYWKVSDTLLVRLPERYVDGKAPVFDSSWDITGAVRVWLADPGRTARVWSPRMNIGPSEITEPGEKTLTYDKLVFLDAVTGSFGKVSYQDLKRLPPVR